MSFSNLQAGAARALLRQSLDFVSKGCGVNKDLISRFERGDGNLSEVNRVKLVGYYENNDIDFLEHDGVRFKPDEWVRQLNGEEGFHEFMDDVYKTTKDRGGDLCVTNVNERNWIKWMTQKGYDKHARRMKKLGNFRFKILVEEGDDFFIADEIAEYRSLPSELFNEQSFYMYGKKVAIVNFRPNDVRILIVNNENVAIGFRHNFNVQWNNIAKEVK